MNDPQTMPVGHGTVVVAVVVEVTVVVVVRLRPATARVYVAAAPISKLITKASKTTWSLFCMLFFGFCFYFRALEAGSIPFRASYAADTRVLPCRRVLHIYAGRKGILPIRSLLGVVAFAAACGPICSTRSEAQNLNGP